MKPTGWGLLCSAAMLAPLAGCFVSKSQLTTVETQNRVLSDEVRAQTAEIENLKFHSRQTEDQLIRAEQELAARQNPSAPVRPEIGGAEPAPGTHY